MPPLPKRSGERGRAAMCHVASQVPYIDQEMDVKTLFVTKDREKPTDSVQGATAQESIDLVEGEESTVSVE